MDGLSADLSGVSFFSICTPEQLGLLAFSSEPCAFDAGDIVYAIGDESDGAYVLRSGTVEIYEVDTPEGKGYQASGPNIILGAMSLVLDRQRVRTIVAVTPLDMVFVPRSAFAKLMRQYPELAVAAAERIKQEMGSYISALNRFRRNESKN
jgi:CRP-like cAMP-binding protein